MITFTLSNANGKFQMPI